VKSSGELPKHGVSRIAGLVIVNAMIFQEVLSSYDGRVESLGKTRGRAKKTGKQLTQALIEHWNFIITEIDYYPIFHVATELLSNLSSVGNMDDCLVMLADRAQSITGRKAALRHDLMGRIFHRMLLEAKYLGTYYTSIPSATMLLRTALRKDLWKKDWGDVACLKSFKIADLACGTGTLLMAAADAVADNAVFSFTDGEIPLSEFNKEVHRLLAEDVIHGYDVLPTALHLTAATLAMRAPAITFKHMNMFVMPLGGELHRLGSLDFLLMDKIQLTDDLFGATESISAYGKEAISNVHLPKFDLVAINPPFTRSVGGNLLFGSIPEARRAKMQEHLKKIVADQNLKASITAGLGAVFVALADRYLVNGGRLCLVLPKALLNGVAWTQTREILGEHYVVEFIFSSHDPEHWNFSESTDLSEIMIIARKLDTGEKPETVATTYINFYQNPTNILEALNVVHRLPKIQPGDLVKGQGAGRISLGDETIAEVVSVPWEFLKTDGSFMWGTAFAQGDLTRVLLGLQKGMVKIPGKAKDYKLPVVALDNLGALGPDRRDIHDGFEMSKSPTAYPCVWGREADKTKRLGIPANSYLVPLSKAHKGRNLRKADDLWPLASDILIAERLRLNTQSMIAVSVNEEVLANMWWTFRLNKATQARSKALVIWLNSTLGLICLLGLRLETEGAWISFKKPVLSKATVLDVEALNSDKVKDLAKAYDKLEKLDILPFPQMAVDSVRVQIDQVIADILGLPDLTSLRTMLGREPFVCLKRL
jgi:hypothetical protein